MSTLFIQLYSEIEKQLKKVTAQRNYLAEKLADFYYDTDPDEWINEAKEKTKKEE